MGKRGPNVSSKPGPSSRKRAIICDSSSEEDENPSSQRRQSSQLSQSQSASQSSQSQQSLSESDLQRLGALCANIFLVANNKKCPIKRADLAKAIPKEFNRKASEIMKYSSSMLEEIFGYKIVETSKKGYFMIINLLDLSEIFGADLPISIHPHKSCIIGLRTHILNVILMLGGTLQEATLREFLKKFNVDIESKEVHPLLGNVQKLIFTDFVRQCYLDVIVDKEADPPARTLLWGERAKLELSKKEVIAFVCKIYGESYKPEMWVEQWKDANSTSTPTTSAG